MIKNYQRNSGGKLRQKETKTREDRLNNIYHRKRAPVGANKDVNLSSKEGLAILKWMNSWKTFKQPLIPPIYGKILRIVFGGGHNAFWSTPNFGVGHMLGACLSC